MVLTGDNAQSAEKVARAMTIDRVHARLSPEAKLKLVERARGRGKGSIVMLRHRTSPRAPVQRQARREGGARRTNLLRAAVA